MTEENITNKIRALLARTEERGATEAEAATAAAKAQELMLRYGIELAQIAEAQGDRLSIGSEQLRGKVDPWRRTLATAIAQAMGGDVLYWNEPRKWTGTLEFWGQRGTVAGIVATYQYLEAQLTAISAIAAIDYGREHGWDSAAQSMRWRRSFLAGAVHRVGQRLNERKQRIEAEADNSRALVLANDAVRDAMADAHGQLRTSRTKQDLDPNAAVAGIRAGDGVDLELDSRVRSGESTGLPRVAS